MTKSSKGIRGGEGLAGKLPARSERDEVDHLAEFRNLHSFEAFEKVRVDFGGLRTTAGGHSAFNILATCFVLFLATGGVFFAISRSFLMFIPPAIIFSAGALVALSQRKDF